MITDIHARSLNRISSQHVKQLDDQAFSASMLAGKLSRERDAALLDFWADFDRIFSAGDRIKWFDGWDMREAVFTGHSRWHINVKTEKLSMGIPIVVDTEFEKIP